MLTNLKERKEGVPASYPAYRYMHAGMNGHRTTASLIEHWHSVLLLNKRARNKEQAFIYLR
jgi:hypothetical protein